MVGSAAARRVRSTSVFMLIPSETRCAARYCGQRQDKSDLFTKDQIAYMKESAAERAKEHISAEFAKMFQQLERKHAGNKFVTFKAGTPYRAKQVTAKYAEKKVDSELLCPTCGSRFQVDGIFAYCTGCGIENIAIYDANLVIIRAEVSAGGDPQRALRHAYGDLVSTFEAICAKRARSLTSEQGSFQDPYDARRFFKDRAGIDILASLNPEELLLLRRVFHKRHVYQHAQGMITDRYVRKVPEDRALLNTTAVLSLPELEVGVEVVRRVVDALLAGI